MVSKQTLEAIGTRKSREADEGKAPKGVELMVRLRDLSFVSYQVGNGKGERAIRRRRCRPLEHQATPGYEGINAATSLRKTARHRCLITQAKKRRGVSFKPCD